jgi:hypothetical protein
MVNPGLSGNRPYGGLDIGDAILARTEAQFVQLLFFGMIEVTP